MKEINFFFDFLSPYSYFSFINLEKQSSFEKFNIHFKPVVMGSLFNHFNMKGPGEILPKRHYMLKQCFIYAAQNNIAFNPPNKHPFNPLYSLRLATKACSGIKQKEIIKVLFASCWAKGLTLGEPEALETVLDSHGFLGKEIIEKTFDKEVKKELKQNIKDATQANIFGVPSFQIGTEVFWGNDSLSNMYLYLNNDFPKWNQEQYKIKIESDVLP